MEGIQPKKLGIIFTPPTLILLYKSQINYKRLCMPIRELSVTSDCSVLAARLQARHKKQLTEVNIIAIEKMIRLIQEVIKGHDKPAALQIIKQEYEINPDEDLNRLNDKELKRRKLIMDLNFKKNNIDKNHPDFVYDKEVEFKGKKKMSGWDSDSDQDDSTPRPVLLDEENDSLYPVQKSPAPSLGVDSAPSEEQISPLGEVSPVEDKALALGKEITTKDKAPDLGESYSLSLKKDSIQAEFLSEMTKSSCTPIITNNEPDPSNNKLGNLTSHTDTLTSQPDTLTSQPDTLTSQPDTLTSQPDTLTSQPDTLTSQPDTLTSIATSKPKPLLEPLALPGLSRQVGSVTFNKALPPLDLNRSRLAPILPSSSSSKALEPIEHLNLISDKDSIKSDHINDDDNDDDDSFSDDSDLLPPVDVHKTSPAKKLFGLDSDEDIQENPPNETKHFGGNLPKSAVHQKNGGKIEAEKSPRSISVGDVEETNEEDDFW